jgi:hypothetical protein
VIDLRGELEREAQRVTPAPAFEGVVHRVAQRRRRRRATAAMASAMVLIVALGAVMILRRDAASTPADAPGDRLAALVVDGMPLAPDDTTPGGGYAHTIDRRDVTAGVGAWTVVVRAADGALGYHSAIVTFPVAAATLGEPVSVLGATGLTAGSTITWPIGGAWARVRGDLAHDQLLALAVATTVVGGRPSVTAVDDLDVAPARPYRASDVNEVRLYNASTVLGFVYTGVLRAGFFEDLLLAQPDRRAITVHGHRAVVSDIEGGNATLAWEPSPGVVAYVGYSGPSLTDAILAELARIADHTSMIDRAAWTATDPQVIDDHNGPSDM